MKRPLEEAEELFRQNEALAGSDREKANFYRGLSLLTEGLRRLERELTEAESEAPQVRERRRFRMLRRPVSSLATPNGSP